MKLNKLLLLMVLLLMITAAGAWAQGTATTTKTVNLYDGTLNPTTWTGKVGDATTFSDLPLTGVADGQTVTLMYDGEREMKSISATLLTGPLVDLSKLSSDDLTNGEYLVPDGATLIGTFDGVSKPYKITIPHNAIVKLSGVTIDGCNKISTNWAGITCAGDAIIVLKDGTKNSVKGFYDCYPGIYVPKNKTLTIKGEAAGTGKLTASSNGKGAGIGGGIYDACGNIDIKGGVITAIGGEGCAGIGSAYQNECGEITISGGTIEATGGENAPGIGSGESGDCGDITITRNVLSVTATKGADAPDFIGGGYHGYSSNLTIDGVSGATTTSSFSHLTSEVSGNTWRLTHK